MIESGVAKEVVSPFPLEDSLDADFYPIDDTDGVLSHADRLNAYLTRFLDTLPNIRGEDGRRRAFVTLCTPDYFFGIVGLARSLNNNSAIPLICLTDSEFNFSETVDLPNVYFVRIPRLINKAYKPGRKEFSNVLSKLWVFGLHAFDKLVFLDSDVCVVSSIDALFEHPSPAFAADYADHTGTQRFNSGVFVIEPDRESFQKLMRFAREGYSYDGADQGLLNSYFEAKHRWLPRKYNVLRHHAYYSADINMNMDEIAIIHYVVKKPWEMKYREACDAFLAEFDDIWTQQLTKDDLLKLIRYWRKDIFASHEGDMASLRKIKKYARSMRLTLFAVIACSIATIAMIGIVLSAAH
ncbi:MULTISPECIES: glycosyltransferase [Rhodomicrobium]|uniref:glycosyltransferase n=1 Tax=Rhodomicrobium TaxID=1068 RepID=UPI000B4B34C1|nr:MULTISPECIES: glycosyltransferase [Rhodomicrobium]